MGISVIGSVRGPPPLKIAPPNTSYITNAYDNVARLVSTALINGFLVLTTPAVISPFRLFQYNKCVRCHFGFLVIRRHLSCHEPGDCREPIFRDDADRAVVAI